MLRSSRLSLPYVEGCSSALHVPRVYALVSVLVLAVLGGGCVSRVQPARFEYGESRTLKVTEVDELGATLHLYSVGDTGANVEINVPPLAVSKPVTLTVSYDDGALIGAAGAAAGGALAIACDDLRDFAEPIELRVRYPDDLKPKAVAGYSIDEQGSLQVLDLVAHDKEASSVSFSTFRPVTFTWTYLN